MRLKIGTLGYLALGLLPVLASEEANEAMALTEANMAHRMMLLVIQLGLILFAAKLGNMLFERFHLPGCLGELTAGIVVGPHLLGKVGLPGFPHGLFPMAGEFPVSIELYGFCVVASIVLLFMVGLETDLGMFLRYSVAGSAVGFGGVVASFVLGDLTAVFLGQFAFGRSLGFFDPACLFLGVISTATSVGITARVLAEKRKLDTPEGVTILAGAVVDDVLGIIMLTVVLGLVTASSMHGKVNWGHIGIIAVKAVGIWLAATAIGLLSARRIGTLLKLFRDRAAIAVMALGLALVLSGLFEEAGLAMIIGAYVMGLSLSRTDIAHVVRDKLTPIYVFLVPLFFGVMGMLVDFEALGSTRILLFGLVYSVVAVAAKVIGGGLPALLFDFNLRGASRVGLGMVPRGEVALIVAGVGLAAGALEPDVFGVAILMTAVSTFVAPPLLGYLFNSPAPGVRHPVKKEAEAGVSFPFPTRDIAEWVRDRLLRTFEAEGFFVHGLEHEHGLYQLRKDACIINLTEDGTDLAFHCAEGDLPLVRTAVYEVLCELQGTVRRLQEPVDVARLGLDMHQGAAVAPAPKGLQISSFMNAQAVRLRLRGTTKTEVLNELVGLLADAGAVTDLATARNDLLAREESMSTGLVEGVAIPHARTTAVSRLVCAVGMAPDGVDFDSIDGEPSKVFVLTLSPEGAPAPHVQFMAALGQAMASGVCERLLTCRTEQEVLRMLSSAAVPAPAPASPPPAEKPGREAVVLKDYLRAELMVPRLSGNTPEEVVDELLDLLHARGLIPHPSAIQAAVHEREEAMPTGLGSGIAVPHVRTDMVEDLVCAVGLKPEGVAFGSLDGTPATLVVLTLSPSHHPTPHVQFMASLVRLLGTVDRQRLEQAGSGEEMRGILVAAATA